MIVIAILLLAGTIIIHEFGHLVAAKKLGIPVLEFSVGFWKKLAGIKIKDTEINLRILPLGGFVRPDEEALAAAPTWKRILILLAGPVMNLAAAVAVLAIGIFCIYASQVPLANLPQLLLIGIQQGFVLVGEIIKLTGTALAGEGVNALSGPVGYVASAGAAQDVSALTGLIVAAALSVGIGLFNLLPIPPLDGGQIVLAVLGKLLKPETRKRAVYTGFYLLILVGVSLVVFDVWRLTTGTFPGL